MTAINPTAIDQAVLPRHVAIIMDGNGRWAEQRGKARTSGHKEGASAVRRAVAFARRNGIEALTLFAFSSENWKRPALEVKVLMELFATVLTREVEELDQHGVQLRIVGDTSQFSKRLQQRIAAAEQQTEKNDKLVLNIAANYGGRWDIMQAAQRFAADVEAGLQTSADLTEDLLGQYMCLADGPPPDLLIRTGGDLRISNFLLWQLAYAELYFCDTLWPDFDDAVFAQAVSCFVARERRFGLTSQQIKTLMAGDTLED
ncbi:di-trans,poly-cis-decaprenylcistransferase [Aliidiomarina sedimenti]|uniref:Ditrans,polycis-undecaprenyl-diphosphate synthase ((2E,6E)-farnesyl-diphosphate specific) n=1 Tax=Aliidiomarina sedimenti TaxID=1933879 RepID=A0ABY0C2K6_9GAMM|nr:polyprenyl diphosphate synthase [Aliidiomarina sedimenti]RUO32036.1 di-trans,poly-cis-decaprenylcistransferase [Aliidiomarina sedimenti]